jgi:hypothetical protein
MPAAGVSLAFGHSIRIKPVGGSIVLSTSPINTPWPKAAEQTDLVLRRASVDAAEHERKVGN